MSTTYNHDPGCGSGADAAATKPPSPTLPPPRETIPEETLDEMRSTAAATATKTKTREAGSSSKWSVVASEDGDDDERDDDDDDDNNNNNNIDKEPSLLTPSSSFHPLLLPVREQLAALQRRRDERHRAFQQQFHTAQTEWAELRQMAETVLAATRERFAQFEQLQRLQVQLNQLRNKLAEQDEMCDPPVEKKDEEQEEEEATSATTTVPTPHDEGATDPSTGRGGRVTNGREGPGIAGSLPTNRNGASGI